MRRTFGIGVVLLVVLGGIAIGLGAYHAGVNHGLSEAANTRVVHVVDGGEGSLVTLGLFERRSGAEAASRVAAGWTKRELTDLLPDPPLVMLGEATVAGR